MYGNQGFPLPGLAISSSCPPNIKREYAGEPWTSPHSQGCIFLLHADLLGSFWFDLFLEDFSLICRAVSRLTSPFQPLHTHMPTDVFHCDRTVVVESTTLGPCCNCVLFGDSQIDLILTPAPDMKQVLDKPGSCGQYENYQRPEGFPVGKQSQTESNDVQDDVFTHCFKPDAVCVCRDGTQYKSKATRRLNDTIRTLQSKSLLLWPAAII